MKERPVLFQGAMVRALLAGTKTQTRRLVKPQHAAPFVDLQVCPYGVPGDRLWVRETWSKSALGVYPCPPCWYRADFGTFNDPGNAYDMHDQGCGGNSADCFPCVAQREGKFKWRPSIYMPRQLSRITLEVTEVRVQRLQEISEEDAKAEGVHHSAAATAKQSTIDTHGMTPCRAAFAALWEQINGKKAPWSSNPFCWAISFRRTV
jgi:hypothetical protein